jgi:hypothetical protein
VRHDQDLPESLVVRMASSAAHVMGRPLASSESATWLREHWKESLAFVKPELDRILADGINHIFYHGTVFSPQDAPWPGWLFYASTQFNPNNPWWDDFAALNRYIARVQSVLQRGPARQRSCCSTGRRRRLGQRRRPREDAHRAPRRLAHRPAGRKTRPPALMDRGFTFDYISDAQLQQTRVEGAPSSRRARATASIVVPAARRMPVATLRNSSPSPAPARR